MQIVETILSAAEGLSKFRDDIEKARGDRRGRTLYYLETMSAAISEAASELQLGNVPREKCSEFGKNADLLTEVLYEVIGDAVFELGLEQLAKTMKSSRGAQKLYDELKGSVSSKEEIEKLNESARLLKELPDSIRAAL